MKSILNSIPLGDLGFKGKTPPKLKYGGKNSTQHNTSSLNGNPDNGRNPSILDLDAKTPKKYLDNPPK